MPRHPAQAMRFRETRPAAGALCKGLAASLYHRHAARTGQMVSVYVARADWMSGEHEIDAGNRLNTTASKGLTANSGYIAEYKARQALGHARKKAWALPRIRYASFWGRCTLMLSNIDSRNECHDE